MTISGRVPLLLALGLLPLLLAPRGETVLVWIALVLAITAIDLALACRPSAIELRRAPVAPVSLGEATASVLRVTNASARRVHLVVRDAWQPSAGATANRHALTLRAGASEVLTTPLRPTRRGDLLAAGVTVRTAGPLGLAGRQRTDEVAGAVRALPAFGSRKHLPSRLQRLRELDGRSAVRVRGQGTEFDALREYVRGDDVRSVDWRASARSRTVVVRTWQPERDRRLVLVLDTSRLSAGRVGDAPRLDAAMDAALLLGALASRAGDRVDVVAGDQVVRSRLRIRGARDAVARLQDAFATVGSTLVEADWQTLAGAASQLGRQRALVVLLTAMEPAAVEQTLLPVLPTLVQHHRVVVASVRDPALTILATARSDLSEVYAAAAAEQAAQQRDHTASALAALGVDVVDADADRLAPALADHYLLLKARGLL